MSKNQSLEEHTNERIKRFEKLLGPTTKEQEIKINQTSFNDQAKINQTNNQKKNSASTDVPKTKQDVPDTAKVSKPKITVDKTTSSKKISNIKSYKFESVLSRIEPQLNPLERMVSRLSRDAVVDDFSSIVSRTILRPMPVFTASAVAAIGMIALSYFSLNAGASTTGTEVLMLLAAGWTVGYIIDILDRLTSAKKSRSTSDT